MIVRLLCAGKPRQPGAIALHDEYAARIRRFGVTYESDWVPEVRQGGRFSGEHVREREARALLEALGSKGTAIAVDPSGASLTSEKLARRLQKWATPGATFLVGGPLGHHRLLLARADVIWSLSSLTFPHELVRVLVAEQVYRAVTILRGVPYHK